jgi:hypothetical protein
VSRRDVLRGVAAAGLGTSLAPLSLPFSLGSVEASAAELPSFSVATATFSSAERDRRWAAVRAIMGRPQWALDAIVTVDSDKGDYARYLTQIGNRPGGGSGPEVIFPRNPAQAVHVQLDTARGRDVWQERVRDWSKDGRLVVGAKNGRRPWPSGSRPTDSTARAPVSASRV